MGAMRFFATHPLACPHLHEAYRLQQLRLGPDVHVCLGSHATAHAAPAGNIALAMPRR
jgi:hypothetical protein